MIQVRVDTRLKQQAEDLFNDLGLDTASAIRLFLKQAVMYQGIPFPIVRQQSQQSQQNPQSFMIPPETHEPEQDNTETDAIINDMDIDF
jgi:addiction module RelB/DinJ family antitoxin